MKYKSVENILPRDQNDVEEILFNFSELIDDAVNFGTHIMKWEIEKKLSGDDSIVPILFFRNILEIAGSISILIRNSSIDSSKSQLRILLENVFGLEYLLEKDTDKRSLSYIVWLTHKDLKFYDKLDSENQIGKQFKANFEKDKLIKDPSLIDQIEYLSHKTNSEELLKLPQYVEIEKEYQKTIQTNKNPNWYSLYSGPKTIEHLAKYLNHDVMYEVMYRKYSENIHATDLYKGKLLTNSAGTVDIIQIRNPKDAQSIMIDSVNYLIMAFFKYFQIRIPNRIEEFQEWYLDFRVRFYELKDPKNTIQYK